MPWSEASVVDQRKEFVTLALKEYANVRELCRRHRISAKTGYKWIARYHAGGDAALADRSRRPRTSPTKTPPEAEAAVLAVRDAHPAWGARKIAARLVADGVADVPAVSTVNAVLARNGRIAEDESDRHKPHVRFERDEPDELWQMDFKGHVATDAGRCHPLTVLDDHSRFALVLAACADESAGTVRELLTDTFRRYGMPEKLLCDNGPPWGTAGNGEGHTELSAWLMRLGIGVLHGRPYHPQTQGKDERFHRTLKAEVLAGRQLADLVSAQRAFDLWRPDYNLRRPHEALGMKVPADRYRPSPRAFPETLPALEYGPGDDVRMVQHGGWVSWKGRRFRVGKAFHGQPVALRPTDRDGVAAVRFGRHVIAEIDLRRYDDDACRTVPDPGSRPAPEAASAPVIGGG